MATPCLVPGGMQPLAVRQHTQPTGCRWEEACAGKPERLASGSDDFTMFLWEASSSSKPLGRMTGHVQLINQVRLCLLAFAYVDWLGMNALIFV